MRAPAVKERPILFAGSMVRAILDCSKTQTRRVCKPMQQWVEQDCREVRMVNGAPHHFMKGAMASLEKLRCPYGQPGDRLWVRETWGVVSNAWDEDGNLVDWIPDRPATEISEMQFGQGHYSGYAIYAADGSYEWAGDDDGGGEPRSAWKPSIHMPRAASRILLEIVSVRVERLQAIGDRDAIAEGIERVENNYGNGPAYCDYRMADPQDTAEWFNSPVDSYQTLWEQINGAGSWDANPWVWRIEFRRVQS